MNFTSRSLTLTNCPPIEEGITYKVTFYKPDTDNTEYEVVSQIAPNGYIYIGNAKHAWGGTDTGEPFMIYNNPSSTAPTILISSSETLPCTYNIKIKSNITIKIDEKYLDIKNINIVNGSKEGSLRTVGSTQEGTSYKMGYYAFSEGYNTKSSGNSSHAEGNNTTASSDYSHAEGHGTTASSVYQHVQGKYNIVDSNNLDAEIIGNGTSVSNRSNAATVDWNGNAWYAGDVYIGSTSGTNKDEGSKKLATEEYANNLIEKLKTAIIALGGTIEE